MSDFNKINDEALENVTGGVKRTIHNDAVGYANVREQPGLDTNVYFTLNNGTEVETTGNTITRDGYTWYEVCLKYPYDYGWIAGNLIGY